jgi:hypothetical protein
MVRNSGKLSEKYVKSLAEGMLAYRIYLSKCGVQSALSEYTFYEPFIRMLIIKNNWNVKCEFPIENKSKSIGDKKRIDFVIFKLKNTEMKQKKIIIASFEIKVFLSNKNHINYNKIINDYNKLSNFKKNSKINDHDSWLLILHNNTKELFEKNIKKYDLESKNINIKCINKTYNIEIIRV